MNLPRPTSRIELSRSAYQDNINFIYELLPSNAIFASVIKGNAYGHGIEQFTPIAFEAGVRHFCVFSAEEAFRLLRTLDSSIYILIMGHIAEDELEWVIEHELDFFVFHMERLKQSKKAAKKVGKPANIHIELETGMNRTGFPQKQFKKVFNYISDHSEHLNFKGICTHFAGAESITNYHRVQKQKKRFNRSIRALSRLNQHPKYIHACCSAAAIQYPNMIHDMARIGILQYGFWPSTETLIRYQSKHKVNHNPLTRVLSWKSQVMEIKEVKVGEFIGYGSSFFTNIPTKIAIVPVGYSYGYARDLSNVGKVLIRGKRLSVIGIVNMNALTVDVTELDHIEKGDEVVLIGKQGDGEITVSSFSDYSNLVNYETLARLPMDVPRIVVD